MLNVYYVLQMFLLNIHGLNLKDKKGKRVLDAFTELVHESNCKPNKLWADKGREFYKKLIQKWFDNNYTLM